MGDPDSYIVEDVNPLDRGRRAGASALADAINPKSVGPKEAAATAERDTTVTVEPEPELTADEWREAQRAENSRGRAAHLESVGHVGAANAVRTHADVIDRRRHTFARLPGIVPAVLLSPTHVGPATGRSQLSAGRPGTRRAVSRSAGGGSSGDPDLPDPESTSDNVVGVVVARAVDWLRRRCRRGGAS